MYHSNSSSVIANDDAIFHRCAPGSVRQGYRTCGIGFNRSEG